MAAKSASWELVRVRTGRDPRELIAELYVEQRYSDQEIAVAIGVSRATVNQWRRDHGISRDDRPAVAL